MTASCINAVIIHHCCSHESYCKKLCDETSLKLAVKRWCIVIAKMMMKADQQTELIFIVPFVWVIRVL